MTQDEEERDNSVTTEDITEQTIISLGVAKSPYPDFAQKFIKRQGMNPAIVIQPNGVHVQSLVQGAVAGGGLDAGSVRDGLILPVDAAAIPLAQALDVDVQFTTAVEIADVDDALIAEFLPGGTVDQRAVEKKIQPKLAMASRMASMMMTDPATRSLTYQDMSAMYAKLMLAAMNIDSAAAQQIVLAAEPFPANAAAMVNTINVADAALNPDTLPDALSRGDVMMVEGTDFSAQDLQIVYWLAAPGRRLNPGANQADQHSLHISRPEIRVTLIRRQAAVAMPAAAMVTSTSLVRFCTDLATRREEWPDLMRGMYMAMEMMGKRIQPAVENRPREHIGSDLSVVPYMMPRPQDRSFFIRLLNDRPNIDSRAFAEVQAYGNAPLMHRVGIIAHYNALMSAAHTTTLYSMNLASEQIQNYISAGPAQPSPQFTNLVNSGVFTKAPGRLECSLAIKARSAIFTIKEGSQHVIPLHNGYLRRDFSTSFKHKTFKQVLHSFLKRSIFFSLTFDSTFFSSALTERTREISLAGNKLASEFRSILATLVAFSSTSFLTNIPINSTQTVSIAE